MAGRYPEDMDPAIKYRTVVLDTFACATRHPELVPAGSLNVNFKPSVQRDFSAVTIDDYYKRPAGQDKGPADQVKPFWESANMDSSMSEGVKKGLVHLLKQELNWPWLTGTARYPLRNSSPHFLWERMSRKWKRRNWQDTPTN